MANLCKATFPYFEAREISTTTPHHPRTKFIRATNEDAVSADDVNCFHVESVPSPPLRQGWGTLGAKLKLPFTTLSTDPNLKQQIN